MPGQVEAAMSRASHLVRAPYLRGKGPSGHGGSGSVHRPGPAGPCQEETIGLQPPPEWRGPGAGWCLPSPPSSPGLGGAPASFPPLGNPCLEGVASRTVLRPGVLPPGDPLASPPPSLPAGGGRPLLCGPLPSPLGGTAPSSLAPLPRLRAPSAQASPRCPALLPCVRPFSCQRPQLPGHTHLSKQDRPCASPGPIFMEGAGDHPPRGPRGSRPPHKGTQP